jgi:hypothetical protein
VIVPVVAAVGVAIDEAVLVLVVQRREVVPLPVADRPAPWRLRRNTTGSPGLRSHG